MEVELAWGGHDIDGFSGYISQDRKKETETLKKLLSLCDGLGIPFSFDIVGHLFLESCDGEHERGHPQGWFGSDPGTDAEQDPEFYAPDLVEMILEADVDHEVCTHTFSHALCDEFPREVLDWELRKVSELHEDICGYKPRSLVAPRHRHVENSLLRENGIRAVRKPIPGHNTPKNKAREYIWKLRRSHPVSEPEMEDGVLETYSTPYPSLTAPYLSNGGMPSHPTFRVIPLSIRQKLHERYLKHGVERAIEANSYTHFWTHLYNLSNDEQMPPVASFLRYLSQKVDNEDIEIKTMLELSRSTVS